MIMSIPVVSRLASRSPKSSIMETMEGLLQAKFDLAMLKEITINYEREIATVFAKLPFLPSFL